MVRDQQSQDVYKEIDKNLQKAYEELVNEELPDRFKILVQQLKRNTLKPPNASDRNVE